MFALLFGGKGSDAYTDIYFIVLFLSIIYIFIISIIYILLFYFYLLSIVLSISIINS